MYKCLNELEMNIPPLKAIADRTHYDSCDSCSLINRLNGVNERSAVSWIEELRAITINIIRKQCIFVSER